MEHWPISRWSSTTSRAVEQDAALGNGGLGRLAACLLDSMATLSLPGYGYGIRYEYGCSSRHRERRAGRASRHVAALRQSVGAPAAGGAVPGAASAARRRSSSTSTDVFDPTGWTPRGDGHGLRHARARATARDTVNNMRLWSAKASRDFNLQHFNEGNYIKAVEQKTESENLSKVLYPDDSTQRGT